jgi:hypothetical protein
MSPADWLNHMTVYKTPWNEISSEEQKTYLPFILNLWLSMVPEYIEVINQVQSYQVPNRDHYNFYLKVLPKKKLFFRWIKPKSKKYNKDVISKLAAFYNEGSHQINDSIDCFEKQDIIHILENMGLSNKEIEKLLK